MNATSSEKARRTQPPGPAGPGGVSFHLRATCACPVAQRAMVQVCDESARGVYVENLVQRGAFIVTAARATGWAAAAGGPHRGNG